MIGPKLIWGYRSSSSVRSSVSNGTRRRRNISMVSSVEGASSRAIHKTPVRVNSS